MKRLPILLFVVAAAYVSAQSPVAAPPPPSKEDIEAGVWKDFLSPLSPRSIGPSNMGGRVADIAVYAKEPRIFYVATASGGLWKTENGGITMKPVFDRESTISLGAVAIQQDNPSVVWVGTGEANSRNSTSWGDGLYKSTDGGTTWTHMGLTDTRHISRIVIDPKEPNTVYVGGLGRLWGSNEERGLYKTTDGGKTWSKILYVSDKAGVIDIQMNPKNPRELVVATWERVRQPYRMTSGGPGSALWKTTDGGKTFKKLQKGLPTTTLGRIGVDYFHANPKVLVATIENKEENGIYKSSDGGESWTKLSNLNPRPFYFSRPRIDPVDENRIYLPAVSFHYSEDGGKTFRAMRISIHVDFHALWINPADTMHMIVGEDGGVGQTRDRGASWEHINSMPIGQFYAVAYDMRKPYWVYGGLQDNGSWAYPTQTDRGAVGFWHAEQLWGGDGFHAQVDPTDWQTAYAESQGGFLARINQRTGEGRPIRPRMENERLRFNWSTPFILSPHNPKTLYVGGNRLFKSVNRGDSWRPISPDLSTNDPAKINGGEGPLISSATGAEQHCTIVTISESPMRQGLLWVGTDDGQVQVTRDDGGSWTNVTANIPGLPANTWCSRVIASKWIEGRAYATFDGHRSNDFKPYLYVTEDYGVTWKSLADGLPEFDCLYVIREGERNPSLLYLGSEMSLRVSLDRGQNWARFRYKFPTVAVHDLLVHPRDLDLIIATHGRSLWTMDVSALEQLTPETREKEAALLKPQTVLLIPRKEYDVSSAGDRHLLVPNTQPGTKIFYHLKKEGPAEVEITISDITGTRTQKLRGKGNLGLNVVDWNGRFGRTLATPGEYRISMTIDGKEYLNSVTVEDVGRD